MEPWPAAPLCPCTGRGHAFLFSRTQSVADCEEVLTVVTRLLHRGCPSSVTRLGGMLQASHNIWLDRMLRRTSRPLRTPRLAEEKQGMTEDLGT